MDPLTGLIGGNLVGGVLGGIGGLFDDSASQAAAMQAALLQQIQNMYKAQGVRRELAFRDARVQKEQLLSDSMGDIDRAEARVGGGGREAQRGIAARGAQTQANATQNLASRGLGNSTIAANAQRGIAADVSRGIAGVDQQVNQQLAGLSLQRQGVRAALGGDLSELPIRNYGFSADANAQLAGILSNVQYQAQPNQLSGLLGSLGSLGGFAMGGGFGGFGGGGGLGDAYGAGGMGPPSPWGF